MSITVTLTTVAIMLLYSVPGYLLIKSRKLDASNIPAFATVLLYFCQPFQTIYAIQQVSFSSYMVVRMAAAFGVGLVSMGLMLGIAYFVLRKKQQEVRYRIYTCATAMSNCGFMGIPLVEALLPEYPEAVAFAALFFLAMNVLMWTVVSFIITRDRAYISPKKIIVNPSSIGMVVALALFFARIELTGDIGSMVTLLGKMSTPICMLILGLRLGTVPIKPIFTDVKQYAAVAVKLVIFPLISLGLCSLLPLEHNFAMGIYIISCAPTANLVLSFAEILGEGQEDAANVVLLSTLLCMFTIPVMMLIV